ncbi:MAG: AAA family ATPase [Lachnospiraceae bacterium]|nr:AAA family ATPase [Lachnospiraceae bacterium]
MYISRLTLQHFGKFHNYDLALSKGMNVIYGSNEAGKTTLKDYVIGMLYGLKPRKDADRADTYHRYQPLSGEGYSGEMTIRQQDKGYVIERFFDKDGAEALRVRELPETGEFPISEDDIPSGDASLNGRELPVLEDGILPEEIIRPSMLAYTNTLCVSDQGASYSSRLAELMRKQKNMERMREDSPPHMNTNKDNRTIMGVLDRLKLTEEQKRQMDPQLRQILGFIKVLFVFGVFALTVLVIYLLPISGYYKLWLIVIALAVVIYIWLRSVIRNLLRSGKRRKARNDKQSEPTAYDPAHEWTDMSTQVSDIANVLTQGSYSDIKVDDHLKLQICKDGSHTELAYLNMGTREQIRLAVRLAAAKEMGWNSMPVILDDIFGAYDDDRLQEALKYLADYDSEQILLFTHEKRIVDMLAQMESEYHYVELK